MEETKLKTYWLGTISEPERARIDHNLLTDDAAYEQVLLAEDDLIEAYLRQRLTPLEQTQFEQHFLADPEHQQKLRLALALQRYANDSTKSSSDPIRVAAAAAGGISWWAKMRLPVWQWAMFGVLLVITLVGIRAIFKTAEPNQTAHSTPTSTHTTTPTLTPLGTAVLAVELFPGQVRAVGTDLQKVQLSSVYGTVQFKLLLLKEAYTSYEVNLLADDEEPQKLAGSFNPQTTKNGNYLLVSVPVTALVAGDYRIKLDGVTAQGTERAETYSFTVSW